MISTVDGCIALRGAAFTPLSPPHATARRRCWISSTVDNYTPLAYNHGMIFIETSIFTKEIERLIPDEDYRMLQTAIMFRPDAGQLIRGGAGLRKIRWSLPGKGKRGSLRVIYYWDPPDTIFMLFPYKKNDQENLTPEQLKLLRSLVKEWLS